jgi:hypothetical protein
VGGLLNGGDDTGTDVSLVACPVGSGIGCQGAGFMQTVRVVAGADYRVGDPRELAVEGADDLYVQAGRMVLAGVQLPVIGP